MARSKSVNIHDAKTHLSRWVDRASAGEEVILAKAGRPVARLVPLVDKKRPRKPGFLKGKIKIARDFDAPLPDDVVEAFEGA